MAKTSDRKIPLVLSLFPQHLTLIFFLCLLRFSLKQFIIITTMIDISIFSVFLFYKLKETIES